MPYRVLKLAEKFDTANGIGIITSKSNVEFLSTPKRNLERRFAIPLKYASRETLRFHYTAETCSCKQDNLHPTGCTARLTLDLSKVRFIKNYW